MDQDLKAYLDQKFQESAQQTQQLREEFGHLRGEFGHLRGEFGHLRGEFGHLREETGQQFAILGERVERLETDLRGAYIAIEDLRGQTQLVAEGVANVAEQLKRHDEKVTRELSEIRSFNRLSYRDLDSRVRKLESAG